MTPVTAGYDLECDPWTGRPELHQVEARRVLDTVPPHAWVVTTCGTETCLLREHLSVRQPLRIGYPEGICVYCGIASDSDDHLYPRHWTGEAARKYVITVPACRECNSAIGDRLAPAINERRGIAHRHIEKKYRKHIDRRILSDDELEEYGPGLRSYMQRGSEMTALTLARLKWPEDPTYDFRAAFDAGIQDPYMVGLLKPDNCLV